MSYNDDIINSIKNIINLNSNDTQFNNPTHIIGTVIPGTVDLTTNTCMVQPLDTEKTIIQNVQLSPASNIPPKYIPANNAYVTVTLFSSSSGFISQEGGAKGVNLAGDTYGGIIIANDLVTALNQIQNLVNNLIGLYNGHIHPTPSGPSSPTASIETGSLPITQVDDITNLVVSHGNGQTNIENQQIETLRLEINNLQGQLNILTEKYNSISLAIQDMASSSAKTTLETQQETIYNQITIITKNIKDKITQLNNIQQ